MLSIADMPIPVRNLGLALRPERDLDHVLQKIRAWAAAHGVALAGLQGDGRLPDEVARRPEESLAEGCDVVIPRHQGCCGALSLHSGRATEAAGFARRTMTAFEDAGVDVVVVNSAGCGSAMKEYTHLFGRGDEAPRAEQFTSKVRDLSEFLAELAADGGPRAVRHPLPVTAVYHEACHLGHAQGIRRQPRDLLREIPGLELVEPSDPGTCCGSAGVYNLLQPEAAGELGARKAASVLATGAPLVISANPGCSLQISAAMAAAGTGTPPAMAHIAEVLDASLRGAPVTELTGRAIPGPSAGLPGSR